MNSGAPIASLTVGNRRLLRLAAVLRELPPERFDFNTWVGIDWKGAADLSCGTTACALGWATTIPSFRRLGLRMHGTGRGGFGYVEWPGHGYNLHAARDFFGLKDYQEAEYLFMPGDDEDDGDDEARPSYDATPKDVAKHIERFVAARKRARS